MAALILAVGLVQGWVVALTILNLCLISAVMSLGVNIQWGYAGLFNAGIMGFAALGGVAVGPGLDAAGQGRALRRRRQPRPRRRSSSSAPSPRRSSSANARRRYLRAPAGLADRARRLLRDADLPRPGQPGDRGDRPRLRRLPRRPRPAGADLLGGRRPLRRRRGLPRRQGRARPALRLSRHRHPRHRRDHPRDPEERELADPRRQERHRPAAPAARRARAAGRALDRRPRRRASAATSSPPRPSSSRLGYAADLHRRAPRHPLALPSGRCARPGAG